MKLTDDERAALTGRLAAAYEQIDAYKAQWSELGARLGPAEKRQLRTWYDAIAEIKAALAES